MKKYDIIGLGEILIDFTESGKSSQGNPLLEANPGGGTGNFLAMASKLGSKTAIISRVGEDGFGRMLADTMREVGIGDEYLSFDKEVPTTLAFVHRLPNGDRDFSFYRNPGADVMISPEHISEECIDSTRVLHFGSLSMTHETNMAATMKALSLAKEKGVFITFDPNLRPPLWRSLEEAKSAILKGMEYCDFLKISDNEIQWLTGIDDYDEGIDWIRGRFPGIRLIALTLGPDGSCAYYGDRKVSAAPFRVEDPVDTTGAGDTFGGSFVHLLLKAGFDRADGEPLSEEALEQMLLVANACASAITRKKGALRMMPDRAEVLGIHPGAEKWI